MPIQQSQQSTNLEKFQLQQREDLALGFGLVDGQALTLDKIGPRLNLSRERVRQIKQKALIQLRTIAETDLIVSDR